MSPEISQLPNRADVILIGFPKCGTTAMHGYFASHPDFNALLIGGFNCEIDTVEGKVGGDLYRQALLSSQQCLFHKFSSYIYSVSKLKRLASLESDRVKLFIAIYGDPVSRLESWYKFHRHIAVTGRNKKHFAYVQRDFYGSCSVDEYYNKFASSLLKYDEYLRRASSALGENKLFVCSQDDLRSSSPVVLARISALLGIPCLEPQKLIEANVNRISTKVEIPDHIKKELQKIYLNSKLAEVEINHMLDL